MYCKGSFSGSTTKTAKKQHIFVTFWIIMYNNFINFEVKNKQKKSGTGTENRVLYKNYNTRFGKV